MSRLYKDVIRPIIQREDVKGKYFKTFFRILKWQIILRVIKMPIIINIIEDASMIVMKGLSGVTGNLYFGLHEYEDMIFCMHFVKENELFYDIGANVGAYSILTSKISKANVVAFEPIEKSFRLLCANVAYNGLSKNIKCVQKGIGSSSSKVFFTNDLDTSNHAVDKNYTGAQVEVDITALDDFISDGNEVPTIVKIDTEGYDVHTIEGGNKFFNDTKIKAVIFEIGDAYEKLSKSFIYNNMKQRGFKAVKYHYKERRLSLLDEDKPKLGNILFVRDLEDANQRLSKARKINVLNEMI